MSYIILCLLKSHISFLYTQKEVSAASPCLAAHLPSIALNAPKTTQLIILALIIFLKSKLLGAVVLFVPAYHLKGPGQEVKKKVFHMISQRKY